MESNASLDTRSSFNGTPMNRRTSASAWGVTPGRQTVSATSLATPRTSTPCRFANGKESFRSSGSRISAFMGRPSVARPAAVRPAAAARIGAGRGSGSRRPDW